ncbi:SGNH/GDSL hydrolase family protein [Prosthecobacter sp.]|jgi:lysophospholipase L1-like esterase|uniref:SGNH/GDSL hydrolase family protein n=1 Tax=Prosthecobacter sp. TaxID=1965333 RepID=UPI0037C63C84
MTTFQPPAPQPRRSRFSLRHLLLCTCLVSLSLLSAPLAAQQAQSTAQVFIPADDTSIGYSGYVHMEFVPYVKEDLLSAPKLARFDRVFDIPGKGYRWDNPGARIRFRTDAKHVKVLLHFNELHTSASARNSQGLYLIDGVTQPTWTFRTKATQARRDPETVSVHIKVGELGGPRVFHDYEIILPYGDSVDFQGIEVTPAPAQMEPPPAAPAVRYVAYGDSVTHGFTASAIDKTYPYLVAQKRGWQLINLGLGGRASNVVDAHVLKTLKADVITVLMGVNDWQGGGPVERYRKNMMGFFDALRAVQPTVPIYFITSLYVPPAWSPKTQIADLEAYRQVAREIVTARKDPHMHLIEGLDLIDHDPKLFDPVAVHPNDQGFAQMGERLAKQMKKPGK